MTCYSGTGKGYISQECSGSNDRCAIISYGELITIQFLPIEIDPHVFAPVCNAGEDQDKTWRSCASDGAEAEAEGDARYAECFEDHCNAALHVHVSSVSGVVLLVLAMAVFRFN